MSKLKVVQLLPELNIGGVERGTKDFSKALIENGHESIVISNGGIFEEDIIKNGGKHLKVPIHKKSIFSLKYSQVLREIYLSEKPDIVHVRSRIPAWINYFAFKKLDNKPLLISTFHGLYSTPIYSRIMSKVDHMIAISDTVKDYIRKTYNVSEDNITTIPRGCDMSVLNNEAIDPNWIAKWYEEFPQSKNKIMLTLPLAAAVGYLLVILGLASLDVFKGFIAILLAASVFLLCAKMFNYLPEGEPSVASRH